MQSRDKPTEGCGNYEEAINEFDIHAKVVVLAKDVLDIRSYFDDIYRSLCRLPRQRSKFKAFFGIGPPGTLTPTHDWDSIRTDYDNLLWDSRSLATTVVNRTEEFRKDIIPKLQESEVPFLERKKELRRFLEDTESTEQSARKMSQGFINIPRRIKDFQIIYSNLLEWGKNDADKRIQQLNSQIDELLKRIEKYTAQHDQAWRQLRTGIPIKDDLIGDSILGAIGALLGAAGREALLFKAFADMRTKSTVAKTRIEISQAKSDLNDKQAELKALEGDATNLLHVIPGHIRVNGSRTEDICERLNAIAKVWGVVRTDAQTLHERMQQVNKASDEQAFNSLLLEREKIIPLYTKLEKVLRNYALAVAE